MHNQIEFDMNIIEQFQFQGEFIFIEPFGCGHINSTFAVYFKHLNIQPERYILQKINTNIFQNPDQLMQNIQSVTSHLRKKIEARNGDVKRETLNIIPTKDGKNYLTTENGDCWRAYIFIDDATCYQTVEQPILFYNAAKSFGRFQKLLADFPADQLFDTIKLFHDTGNRYKNFTEAVDRNRSGRRAKVLDEIEFVNDRENICGTITDLIKTGEMPLRVTHNDTKLNNIMIDNDTLEGICVIDLDTVMSGSVLYDFGDSIRFGASSAAEDEQDLDKVYMDISLFEEYTKGFLSEAAEALTEKEIELLAFSSIMMTFECGMRFLTDHLDGDNYFKIHRENHNLDRARTQFKLVADMEKKLDEMNAIVRKYAQK